MELTKQDIRNHNVGASDYSTHKYQVWDFWITFKMNAFDGDILKRILRHKSTDPREMDYKKIIHICQERIRQIYSHEWYNNSEPLSNNSNANMFDIMIMDYSLNEYDHKMARLICNNPFESYENIIQLCETALKEIA